MHRPMRDLFLQTITLNILGKVFNRHFEIFLSFFQEIRICISCKLSPLHEMSNPIFLVIKQITIFFFFLSSTELAQIVVIRYPRAPIVVSLSKTLYPRILVLVSTQEGPRRHMTILCEDAFPPMLGLYVRLFYSLNKLRSWFCISNVEDTKTKHFTWKLKV